MDNTIYTANLKFAKVVYSVYAVNRYIFYTGIESFANVLFYLFLPKLTKSFCILLLGCLIHDLKGTSVW